METLAQARERFFNNARGDGMKCPCCERYGKVYKRTITSSMAAVLIIMHRNQHLGFYHIPTLINATTEAAVAAAIRGDFAKLRYWGLIVEEVVTRGEDKKNTGRWMITQQGIDFVEARIDVQASIYLYNGKVVKGLQDGTTMNIYAALRNKFSYQQLMNG